tara:strand:+ start:573 stop:848 length:276 start_codon:yes stop_codon:yes gene_type:complete
MTYTLQLNFGRSREINPCDMMTSSDFDIVAFKWFGIDFWINQEGGHATQKEHDRSVMYYFNLWHETMKQNRKCGQSYDFPAYMNAILEGKC